MHNVYEILRITDKYSRSCFYIQWQGIRPNGNYYYLWDVSFPGKGEKDVRSTNVHFIFILR